MRRPAALAAAAFAVLGLVQAKAEKCSAGFVELPVKMEGWRPIATIGVNGTPVPLLVDSGAFFSMLTGSTAAQLGLPLRRLPFQVHGLNGRIDAARMTTVDHVQLMSGDLRGIDFVVGGNEIGETAMGVMGRNILGAMDVEYDLAHGVIRFVRTSGDCDDVGMAYWAGTMPVSQIDLMPDDRVRTPALRAIVKLNGHRTTALFDTGAITSVSLSAAHDAGIRDAAMRPAGEMSGAGRGKARSWSADFDSVALGDESVQHNRLEVDDFDLDDADMLIGVDFFLSHRIYVSKAQNRLYFTYNGGAVFAQNHDTPPKVAASTSASASAAAPAPDTLSADEHARRGAASLARGDLAAALADLDRACALAPSVAAYLVTRAQIHGLMKSPASALADLDDALRLQPGHPKALMDRAELHVAMREHDLALADLASLDKVLAPQAHERFELATLLSHEHQPDAAIAQWTAWLAAHPYDIRQEQAYNARCWNRMQLGRELDLAMKDCEEALDADSKNPDYLDSRGWLWLRLAQPAKARADFDRALARRDDAAMSMYGRGLARLRLGDATGAQSDFAAARARARTIDADAKGAGLPLAPDADAAMAAAAEPAASAATR